MVGKSDMISAEKVLKIGQKVEVVLEGKDEDLVYASRIEDVTLENLILAMPMEKGYPIIPMKNTSIYVRVVGKQTSYRFVTVFLDKMSTPIPVWKMIMPKLVEKFQQREFVRIPVFLSALIQTEDAEHHLLPPMPIIVRDISGSGMQISIKKPLKIKEKIYIHIRIEDIGHLRVSCQVVRCDRVASLEEGWLAGVNFLDLSENVQRRLIKYIFDKQRELLKKSLL